MKKKYVVKEHVDFTNIIQNGRYYRSKYFVIYMKKNDLDHYRFGISVGKKVGNAVIRNKVKRQMRMIIDNYKKNYQNDMDYIIIIKSNYVEGSFLEIKNSFEEIIYKMNRSNNKEKKNEI